MCDEVDVMFDEVVARFVVLGKQVLSFRARFRARHPRQHALSPRPWTRWCRT
jgi:hypothetical protein